MNYFFLDTSAVIKRYIVEQGTNWIGTLTNPAAQHTVVLSEITLAEVAAALSARHRASGGISQTERDRVLALFIAHCDNKYDLVAVNRTTVNRAVRLTQQHRLRGCDSLQLATALIANERLVNAGASPLTFVAADDELIAAATAEGMATENPNHHP